MFKQAVEGLPLLPHPQRVEEDLQKVDIGACNRHPGAADGRDLGTGGEGEKAGVLRRNPAGNQGADHFVAVPDLGLAAAPADQVGHVTENLLPRLFCNAEAHVRIRKTGVGYGIKEMPCKFIFYFISKCHYSYYKCYNSK